MSTTLVFGAFDRHNLGDLLFAHVAQALLPAGEPLFCGLAARDLRPFGGHAVAALHALQGDPRVRGARLLHAGGEILACTAQQAAVMLLAPDEVDATLAMLGRHPEAEPGWRRALLGTAAELPYVAGRDDLPGVGSVLFAGVGGVAIERLGEAARDALAARLRAADAVTVRDAVTQGLLRELGIAARVVPDPVVMVEHLFGDAIRARMTQPAVLAMREAFPGGWLALQLSTEFADDATLARLAPRLEAAVADTGLGIVLFRAAAAPWHDDAALLERLAQRLPAHHVRVFESLDVWDLCALLASARAFAGSSLHGCIVANAFGVPALGLEPAAPAQGSKLAAVVATWHAFDTAIVGDIDDLPAQLRRALAADPAARLERAAHRVAASREAWQALLDRGQDTDLTPL
jgi:hypothetical protein